MGVATLYGIRNCDTVKKVSGVEAARPNRWCGDVGWEALLNRAGTTETAVALMLAQPSIIKRPVMELRDRVIVGFKPELYKSLQW